MIKQICIAVIAVLAFIPDAMAQRSEPNEKIVRNKWSMMFGTGNYVNHFMTNQEYTGLLFGIKGEHGALYKRSENLSWDYDIAFLMSPYSEIFSEFSMANPANTTYAGLYDLNTSYGTHYNWYITDRLSIKAGGKFDILAGINTGDENTINKSITFDLQTQLEVSAGIKYGWTFNRFGIDLFGNLSIPFMGFMLVDSRFQHIISVGGLLPGTIDHFIFSSFHNLQGYESEIGMDLNFKNITFSLSNETFNRWWNAYDLQSYRLFSFFKIGLSVDLVSKSRLSSNNRYF